MAGYPRLGADLPVCTSTKSTWAGYEPIRAADLPIRAAHGFVCVLAVRSRSSTDDCWHRMPCDVRRVCYCMYMSTTLVLMLRPCSIKIDSMPHQLAPSDPVLPFITWFVGNSPQDGIPCSNQILYTTTGLDLWFGFGFAVQDMETGMTVRRRRVRAGPASHIQAPCAPHSTHTQQDGSRIGNQPVPALQLLGSAARQTRLSGCWPATKASRMSARG
ncbi:hypothetical protein J3F84DRAFT_18475 [Trichoderma pleuroticola]